MSSDAVAFLCASWCVAISSPIGLVEDFPSVHQMVAVPFSLMCITIPVFFAYRIGLRIMLCWCWLMRVCVAVSAAVLCSLVSSWHLRMLSF